MRDVVEIGIGREARRTYELYDVNIVPSRRTRSSKDVDTSWKIDAYDFGIPVMTHPTDAIGGPEFLQAFDDLGGLAVLNGEGLFARHADAAEKIAQLRDTADGTDDPAAANRLLQEFHAVPVDEELLTGHVTAMREAGMTVAVRVSPQNARELTPVLVKAGIDLLVIQGTLVSAEHVTAQGEPLNLKDFIGGLDVPVIVGGVVDYATALHLMRTGAAGVIVGPGDTTTPEALGISVPMATAIADAAAARKDYLDETGGRYVHVIADGALTTSGDIARAIACGADAVALGAPLAQAAEAPGAGFYWQSVAAHPKFPRGYVARVAAPDAETADLPSLEQVVHGPTSSPFGAENLIGGLRRTMAKCGYTSVKAFQRVKLAVRPDLV